MADPQLLSVEHALNALLATTQGRTTTAGRVDLRDALGLVLAESVVADLDLPPFDKSLVDGFAVRGVDLAEGDRAFDVVGEILAGQTFGGSVESGQAVAIMTGAPIPPGADSVVMVERVKHEGGRVWISGPIKVGQNRLLRGKELRAGDVVARAGSRIGPAMLGVLASVGRHRVSALLPPKVAIVATGDEIVEIDVVPAAGQIRNSNSTLLEGLMRTLGATTWVAPIAPDEPVALESILRSSLDGSGGDGRPADVLLISGGVSAGNRDLVPAALERIGATRVFHKVNIKPGKPLWFGTGPSVGGRGGALIFGLPGNPVSGLVCSLVFVAAALNRLSGGGTRLPERQLLAIDQDFEHKEARATYYPARLTSQGRVEPLVWSGSSDLKTIAEADGFVVLEPGENRFKAGDPVWFLAIPGGLAPDRWSRNSVFSEVDSEAGPFPPAHDTPSTGSA